jgi:branched-chain amino acid transport system permease protein
MPISPNSTFNRMRYFVRYLPVAAAMAVILYALVAQGYIATVAGFALIYAIFVAGLNIFMGYAGQASFGQNAFAAIGGYTSAILSATYDWPVIPAIAAGLCGAVLFATIIGYPTLRLKGHYLAMATLAIGLITYEGSVQWSSLTQGYMGISGIPPLGIGSYEVTSDRAQIVTLSVIAGLCILGMWLIRRSRLGRAFVALSGSENAARALGINVARYKLAAFVISAAYASLAGSLFVHVVGFVSPEVFGMNMVILSFTMLYVGGIGTVAGAFVGATVVGLLPETLRAFKDYQDLIYGVALILLLIYAPRGVASLSEAVDGGTSKRTRTTLRSEAAHS